MAALRSFLRGAALRARRPSKQPCFGGRPGGPTPPMAALRVVPSKGLSSVDTARTCRPSFGAAASGPQANCRCSSHNRRRCGKPRSP
eukprot:11946554-Alexandrium_andersonii.AAC.1